MRRGDIHHLRSATRAGQRWGWRRTQGPRVLAPFPAQLSQVAEEFSNAGDLELQAAKVFPPVRGQKLLG